MRAILSTSLLAAALILPAAVRADTLLGLAGPFTGPVAPFGEQMRHGADMAVADINAAGGVLGQKLVLAEGDDACDPKQGVAVANELAGKGVKAVIGHFCSGTSIPASDVYQDENLVQITPGSTNPTLTERGLKNVFRVCGRDDQQGRIDGLYLAQHFKGGKIAILDDKQAYGEGLANEVRKALNAAGIHETLDDKINPGEKDYATVVTRLKQAGVDVVFLWRAAERGGPAGAPDARTGAEDGADGRRRAGHARVLVHHGRRGQRHADELPARPGEGPAQQGSGRAFRQGRHRSRGIHLLHLRSGPGLGRGGEGRRYDRYGQGGGSPACGQVRYGDRHPAIRRQGRRQGAGLRRLCLAGREIRPTAGAGRKCVGGAMMRRRALLIAVLAVLAGRAQAAEDHTFSLKGGKYQRVYTVHVPDTAGRGPMPVVLVLPEAGSDGAQALNRYGWKDLADKQGFIAVGLTPLAVDPSKAQTFQKNPTVWSDGSGRGNATRGSIDDGQYARAVLEDLGKRYIVDERRLYAVGFGNGGSMAQLLGLVLSDRLAAVASIAGHLWSLAPPVRPLPVMLIYGAADPVDPIDGGTGVNMWTHGPEQRPAPRLSADRWAKALGCEAMPQTTRLAGKVTDTAWRTCPAGASVDMLTVPDLGHRWPGGTDDAMPADMVGPANNAFQAAPFLWNFFGNHPKG